MQEEQVTLTGREQKRARVLNEVLAGRWTRREAAQVLGLSERHLRRLLAAYGRDGPRALVHGNRGRPSVRAWPAEVGARVVELARSTYAGFNHQHFTERLAADEGLVIGRTTVRRFLVQAGLVSPRRHRPPKHRTRRERMPQAGMLLQADGSRHRWLGPDGPLLTLIGGIDDATGTVPWALFRGQEDAQGYMLWLHQVVQRAGIPLALYVDRHGIFQRSPREPLSLEEELAGGPLPTQFGRVLQELNIQRIDALSPQAKGRVERLWGTLQDRLVAELRLAGATTLEQANQVLGAFLERFNARFTVPPVQAGSAYRPLPEGFVPEQVFCFKYQRVVSPDNTVRFAGRSVQLLADPQRASYSRATVEVHERLDGGLAVFFQGRCLATRPAPPTAPTLRARKGPRVPRLPARDPRLPRLHDGTRPAANHPWRRPYTRQNVLADPAPALPVQSQLATPA